MVNLDEAEKKPAASEPLQSDRQSDGRAKVESARKLYESVLKSYLNTRGGSSVLRTPGANRTKYARRVMKELPFEVAEARAALLSAYNDAVAGGANISVEATSTHHGDHHHHDDHHDHHDEHEAHLDNLHSERHESEAERHCEAVEQKVFDSLGADKRARVTQILKQHGMAQSASSRPFPPLGSNNNN